jgi:hypothetical protein
MSDRETVTPFFQLLLLRNDPREHAWIGFVEEVLQNDQVYAEKEPSLLAIYRLWHYSSTGEKVAALLVEQDHFRFWDSVEFQEENSDERRSYFCQSEKS